MSATCRFCHKWDLRDSSKLVKYGLRHYAHARCGLERFGVVFFDRLSLFELTEFPALVAADYGLLDELRKRIKRLRKSA